MHRRLAQVEISSIAPSAPSLSMNAIWRTIRGYVMWQYERGTLHYDIMVTLILIFLFLSPYWIHYNDKPVARNPHPMEIVVTPGTEGRLFYQIDASTISAGDEDSVRRQLLQKIETISSGVAIVNYDTVSDAKGHVQSYKVLAQKK